MFILDKENLDKSIFKKEYEILENSKKIAQKTDEVIKNAEENYLLNEYLFLSKQYKKLLKDIEKITTIGDMNQRKLFEANEIMQRQNLEIEKKNEELYKISIYDGLTKQYNRAYILDILSEEFAKSKENNLKLSFIIFDIDHFKLVNDNFGHQAGDTVLVDIAGLIRKKIKKEYLLGRYGGEEFVIVLPETSLKSAEKMSEKIRKAVEEKIFIINDKEVKITISCGVSDIFTGNPENVDMLIRNADEALYKAKTAGRNCTSIHCCK